MTAAENVQCRRQRKGGLTRITVSDQARKISDLRYQADTLHYVPYRRLQSRMDKDEDGSDPPSIYAELTRAALVQLVVRKEDVERNIIAVSRLLNLSTILARYIFSLCRAKIRRA